MRFSSTSSPKPIGLLEHPEGLDDPRGSQEKGFAQDTIQWYPGHIAKWDRELATWLPQCDMLIEVRDARLPNASAHPRFQEQIQGKARVLLLTKADLADPVQTKRWVAHLRRSLGCPVLPVSSHQRQWLKGVLEALVQEGRKKRHAKLKEGLRPPPIRAMVVGMPNVGKSSLINALSGKNKVKTGHKAGVTRHPQWVKLSSELLLLDSPGLIPPKLASQEDAWLLATVDAIGEAAYQVEPVARYILALLATYYPQGMCMGLKVAPEALEELLNQHSNLEWLSRRWHYRLGRQDGYVQVDELHQGLAVSDLSHFDAPVEDALWDLQRTSTQVLKWFYSGKLGRFTLERCTSGE
ncbi:MAG: ribosome biogenesis GTPase YlqF [Vampirovibrionales bacterium]